MLNVEIDYTCKTVRKLIGNVRPIGDTHYDDSALQNLIILIGVLDQLLADVDVIALERTRPEYSRSRAGKLAYEFLNRIGIQKPAINPNDICSIIDKSELKGTYEEIIKVADKISKLNIEGNPQ